MPIDDEIQLSDLKDIVAEKENPSDLSLLYVAGLLVGALHSNLITICLSLKSC